MIQLPCTEETPLTVERMAVTVVNHFPAPAPSLRRAVEAGLFAALERFAAPEEGRRG